MVKMFDDTFSRFKFQYDDYHISLNMSRPWIQTEGSSELDPCS